MDGGNGRAGTSLSYVYLETSIHELLLISDLRQEGVAVVHLYCTSSYSAYRYQQQQPTSRSVASSSYSSIPSNNSHNRQSLRQAPSKRQRASAPGERRGSGSWGVKLGVCCISGAASRRCCSWEKASSGASITRFIPISSPSHTSPPTCDSAGHR